MTQATNGFSLLDRRTHEDLHLFSMILNQEIKRLSAQVIRVKWSLHAREEIVIELLRHLRGNAARGLLEGIRTSTREAIHGCFFTVHDAMQGTVRAWLQFLGAVALFNQSSLEFLGSIWIECMELKEPHMHWLCSLALSSLLGVVLIAIGLLCLGLKEPILEEDVAVRKLKLQQLVRIFEQEAKAHAQVQKNYPSDI